MSLKSILQNILVGSKIDNTFRLIQVLRIVSVGRGIMGKYIRNLEATIMYKDEPVVYFKVKDKVLLEFKRLSEEHIPGWFLLDGDNYFALQEFFEDRTVPDYQMMSREYVRDVGLPFYDFEKIVKMVHSWKGTDYYWIKYPGEDLTYAQVSKNALVTEEQRELIMKDLM